MRRLVQLLGIAILALLAPIGSPAATANAENSLAAGRLAFSPARYYIRSANPLRWLAVGDLNRDRRKDLVAGAVDTEGGTWKTRVLLGRAGGEFSRARDLGLSGTGGVAVADFDGDANPDVLRSSYTDVLIGLGDGRGGVRARERFRRVGTYLQEVVVRDFNRDGVRDVLLTDPEGPDQSADEDFPAVSLMLGDGLGGFAQPRRLDTGIGPVRGGESFDLAVGAFDGDAYQDLVVTNSPDWDFERNRWIGDGDLRLLRGDPEAGFVLTRIERAAGRWPFSVAVGRFNQDAALDLAVVNFDPETRRADVRVLVGDGLGAFHVRAVYKIGYVGSIATGDLNGDGKQDLAVQGRDVLVLLGRGGGRFLAPVRFRLGGEYGQMVVADLNHDRRLDLAGTCGYGCGKGGKGAFVLLNRTR